MKMDENGFMAQPVEQPKDGDGETQVSPREVPSLQIQG